MTDKKDQKLVIRIEAPTKKKLREAVEGLLRDWEKGVVPFPFEETDITNWSRWILGAEEQYVRSETEEEKSRLSFLKHNPKVESYHEIVKSFILENPELFDFTELELQNPGRFKPGEGYPTPDRWAELSDSLKFNPGLDIDLVHDLVKECNLGSAAAILFSAYMRNYLVNKGLDNV